MLDSGPVVPQAPSLWSNLNPHGNPTVQRQTSHHQGPKQSSRTKLKLWAMQSQTLHWNNKWKYSFSRIPSVELWQTTPMEPWGENTAGQHGPGCEFNEKTRLLMALLSETTTRSWGNTHIWQTDGGREMASPFVNSIPVDSLGRTANAENKHSLWLQKYNCSLPNNS